MSVEWWNQEGGVTACPNTTRKDEDKSLVCHLSGAIPVFRPTLPSLHEILEITSSSIDSGIVTLGKVVSMLEAEACAFTGVRHAVAVANCTSGLMLAFASMGLPRHSEVIVPSFTFAATVQALYWNQLTPVFVDCLPGTMTMDPEEATKAFSSKTSALYPVNIFGLPPDLGELQSIADRKGVPLVMDSAQGLGALYSGQKCGSFGVCEVFSLSPTKVITAIEGGLITTDDEKLANKLRAMRDYGKGSEDHGMIYNGLSARMSELHAGVGLLSLRNAGTLISSRMQLIMKYRKLAQSLQGCSVQEFPSDRVTSGNYFVIRIGPSAKRTRDQVYDGLKTRGIQTKKYFYPPVHVQPAFEDLPKRVLGELPVTWEATKTCLALPLFAHMIDEQQEVVIDALEKLLE